MIGAVFDAAAQGKIMASIAQLKILRAAFRSFCLKDLRFLVWVSILPSSCCASRLQGGRAHGDESESRVTSSLLVIGGDTVLGG